MNWLSKLLNLRVHDKITLIQFIPAIFSVPVYYLSFRNLIKWHANIDGCTIANNVIFHKGLQFATTWGTVTMAAPFTPSILCFLFIPSFCNIPDNNTAILYLKCFLLTHYIQMFGSTLTHVLRIIYTNNSAGVSMSSYARTIIGQHSSSSSRTLFCFT